VCAGCYYVQVAGQKQQTVVMPRSVHPVYNAHFEFFNVQLPDTLTVQVSTPTGQPEQVAAKCLSSLCWQCTLLFFVLLMLYTDIHTYIHAIKYYILTFMS
jgi:hypothetical protein